MEKIKKTIEWILNNKEKLKTGHLDDQGREINNPKSDLLKTGLNRPLTIQQQIQRVMRVELSRKAEEAEMETFEEATDFEIEDEFENADEESIYQMEEEIPTSMVPETPPLSVDPTGSSGEATNAPETLENNPKPEESVQPTQ